MTEIVDETEALDQLPRPLTPAVRRRAWGEPHVRFWWLAALVVFVAGVYLGVTQHQRWSHEQWLMSLPATKAIIDNTPREMVKHRPVKSGETMNIAFPFKGRQAAASIPLVGYIGEAMIGEPILIHVNPDDETDLTIRNEPQTWITAIAAGLIAASFGVLPLLIALRTRSGVLRTWRLGTARPASVLGRQSSALAPQSRSVRCAWDGEGDRRLFSVFVPNVALESGSDQLRVLSPPDGKGRPLALAWFEPL